MKGTVLVSFQGLFCVYSSSTQQVLFGLINPNLYDESWNDIYFPFEIGCLTQKCVLVRVLVFYQLVRKKNGYGYGYGYGIKNHISCTSKERVRVLSQKVGTEKVTGTGHFTL